MTETALVRRLLLRASELGQRLFRNQVGQYRLALPSCKRCQQEGRIIRSGLCVGSSDLIGWAPVVITPEMVGQTVAVFTAVEAKCRAVATSEQIAFLNAVHAAGGRAILARSESDL